MPCLNDGGDVQLVSGDPVSDAGGLVVYRPGIENSDTECRWDGRSSHSMPNCLAAFAMAFFQPLLRRTRSFKVTDFGTNRKPMYHFSLIINTN